MPEREKTQNILANKIENYPGVYFIKDESPKAVVDWKLDGNGTFITSTL